MTSQIFYADVKISTEVLANEWDKRLYLTSLGEAAELFKTQIYAFCVLDDRIRLLAGGLDVKKRTIRRMLITSMGMFEREAEMIGETGVIPADTVMSANVLRIEDEKDAVSVLRYIHLTPFSEKYTISAQEYWWTSYSTYRSHYKWPMVAAEPVLKYLGRRDSRAVFTLAEYHRRGETLGNPVPACIRKGEYDLLAIREPGLLQGNLNETFMARV